MSDDESDKVSGGNTSSDNYLLTYILTAIIILILFTILMNYVGGDCAAMFQGSFPVRSDLGSDKFDLQKEVQKLMDRQMMNLS